jgi:glutaredoxin
MENKKNDVILLVSKWCEECVPADNAWKRLAEERKDFNYRSLDVSEPEGRRLSIELYIRSVPSTIIDGKLAFVGIPTKEEASELIDLS